MISPTLIINLKGMDPRDRRVVQGENALSVEGSETATVAT